jgi:hypothetical protein
MSNLARSTPVRAALVTLAVVLLIACAVWLFQYQESQPRGEALGVVLRPLINQQNTDTSIVARAILDNYLEARTNASRWSGVYWGFTFLAAALSALAGLILKFEWFLKNEHFKKDVAAIFAICAALLITISTSGDFQRKWQANRIAAAELERIGYELLERNATDPNTYFSDIANILYKRHVGIVGSMEQRKPVGSSKKATDTPK